MKLEIGETWNRDREEYVEELKVDGLQAIEGPIPDGEIVVPRDGDSIIEVRVINSISAKWFTTKMTLRQLNENWERSEVPA